MIFQGAIGGAWTFAAAAGARASAPGAFPIEAWMALASVPGASWAMLDSAGLTTGAAGYAKTGERRATPETLFEAASLSKPVLAAAIHDLISERLIDLDEPVAHHVDFTSDPATRMVTPRHLLSHSSGLPNWRTDAGSKLVSRFRPGSAFRYSGEGFVLLGRLIEAVTGHTAAETVRSRILIPAGMTRSTYGWPATNRPAVAWPHDAGGDVMPAKGPEALTQAQQAGPARPVESWTEIDRAAMAKRLGKPALPIFMTPNLAAGLWTTAGDYARFLRHARRYPAMSTPTIGVEGSLTWGLGWGLEMATADTFAWHWGANDGVANLFALDLTTGNGLVVLTNGSGGQRVYERAARVHFRREFDAFTWLQP
jgi:CubicO group peptidase (beta-lactamase class C family)